MPPTRKSRPEGDPGRGHPSRAASSQRSPGPDRAVRIARVYDPPSRDDGARVLVDRLWPRGLKKDDAALDAWCKDVAPSAELRRWYGHDPARFAEFTARYRAELDDPTPAEALSALRRLRDDRGLTLLTATKTLDLSQAAVLAEILSGR